jgi:3,4-dihydroxy 2-butanone 4-phosphate synthase / GTP cyclohydrolase II
VRGDLSGDPPPLVRVHSHCLTGDAFGSTACDCCEAIDRSLSAIAKEGRGVFVYLHQTGRGFRIDPSLPEGNALPVIRYHERGRVSARDNAEKDAGQQRIVQRESGIGAQILIDLGLRRIRVLTNHPRRVVALEGYGLEIVDQIAISALPTSKETHQTL